MISLNFNFISTNRRWIIFYDYQFDQSFAVKATCLWFVSCALLVTSTSLLKSKKIFRETIKTLFVLKNQSLEKRWTKL